MATPRVFICELREMCVYAENLAGEAVFLSFEQPGKTRKINYIPSLGFINDGHEIPSFNYFEYETLNKEIASKRGLIPTEKTRHHDREEIVQKVSGSRTQVHVAYTLNGEWSFPLRVFTADPLTVGQQTEIKRLIAEQKLWISAKGPNLDPDVRFFVYLPTEAYLELASLDELALKHGV